MENSNNYIPISCSFYDRIEEAIVLRKQVSLIYQLATGTEMLVETILKDTQTSSEGEFVLLMDGEKIRMDRIISLDGNTLQESC